MRFLPRTVVVLGVVSFMNDAASEMIAPLLPLFLTLTLGAGPAVVGLMEGLAEAATSLLKLVSGRLADRGVSPKRLVVGGYAVSNAVRPLLGLATGWFAVVALRTVDRVGKGLRTAPRDAIIAAAVPQARRGQAFGFHRAMDHAGAMVGPLLAFVLLQQGVELRHVFLASMVPGMLVIVLLVYGLPHSPAPPQVALERLRWKALDTRLRALIIATAALAMSTAPEVFLVLWLQARGLELMWVPLVWALAHALKMAISIPAGTWSDRIGRVPVVALGWGARVVVLVLLAVAPEDGAGWSWGLFLAYAAALASTEGAERALIGDVAPITQKATAFGIYHMLTGVLALPGAVLFGVLWQWWGMSVAFTTAAVLTAASAAVLLVLCRRTPVY